MWPVSCAGPTGDAASPALIGSFPYLHADDADAIGGWSRQLGWSGGLGSAPSWGFELDADDFRAAVDRVTDSRVSTWFDAPQWVGYWSFPVRDPMGNTVEVSCADEAGWDER